MLIKSLKSLAMLALVAGLGACASSGSAPTYLVAQAEETLSQAKNSGANSSAPLALKNAEDNLRKAKNAMKDEEYKLAKEYLERSLVESEYAVAKSEADKTTKAAEQVKQSLETLRSETLKSN